MHRPKAQLSKAVKKSLTIYKLFKIENENYIPQFEKFGTGNGGYFTMFED